MTSDGDSDMCWICLEEAAENGSHQLVAPCKCPRKVHPQCLARWQLQQAGRHEEKFCRFCNNELADWKRHLTPEELKPEVSKVQPIMVVYFEGQIHRIPVKQGPDGLDEFTTKIRELFRLPEDVDISLTFGCKEPMSGSHLKLEGMGAFDAAVHCASVAAAERQQKIKKSYSTGSLGAAAQHPTGAASGSPEPAVGARSASQSSLPATHAISAAAGHAAAAGMSPPATPPPAAGASAARSAAQDRRHRFLGQQQPQHQQQQQLPPAAAGVRSRSFSAFSSSSSSTAPAAAAAGGPRGQEPPAAFRSILGLLSSGVSGSSQQAAHGGGGRVSPAPAQASPRGRAGGLLPPLSPGGSSAAAVAASPPASAQQQQQDDAAAAALKRDRLSLRSITQLTDVPECDETVAVGSLSGKFRFHLKAFSRKVARSLSFSNRTFDGEELAAAGADGSATGSIGSIGSSSAAMMAARSGSAGSGAGAFAGAPPLSPPALLAYSSAPSAEAPLAEHPSPRGAGGSPLPPPTPPGIYSSC